MLEPIKITLSMSRILSLTSQGGGATFRVNTFCSDKMCLLLNGLNPFNFENKNNWFKTITQKVGVMV